MGQNVGQNEIKHKKTPVFTGDIDTMERVMRIEIYALFYYKWL